jgi:hypothetical protein
LCLSGRLRVMTAAARTLSSKIVWSVTADHLPGRVSCSGGNGDAARPMRERPPR